MQRTHSETNCSYFRSRRAFRSQNVAHKALADSSKKKSLEPHSQKKERKEGKQVGREGGKDRQTDRLTDLRNTKSLAI